MLAVYLTKYFSASLVVELAMQRSSDYEIGIFFSGGLWKSFYFTYKIAQMCLVMPFSTSCLEHKCGIWSSGSRLVTIL